MIVVAVVVAIAFAAAVAVVLFVAFVVAAVNRRVVQVGRFCLALVGRLSSV